MALWTIRRLDKAILPCSFDILKKRHSFAQLLIRWPIKSWYVLCLLLFLYNHHILVAASINYLTSCGVDNVLVVRSERRSNAFSLWQATPDSHLKRHPHWRKKEWQQNHCKRYNGLYVRVHVSVSSWYLMGRSLVRVYLDHVLCRGYAIHTKCMHSEGDDALSKHRPRRKWHDSHGQ